MPVGLGGVQRGRGVGVVWMSPVPRGSSASRGPRRARRPRLPLQRGSASRQQERARADVSEKPPVEGDTPAAAPTWKRRAGSGWGRGGWGERGSGARGGV